MPGGKGPSQSGNITQTTVNPTQQAQLPFLVGQPGNGINGWGGAATLARTDPLQYFPGQTLAQDSSLFSGYNALAGAGNGLSNSLIPVGNGAFLNAATGGMGIGNSPAYPGLNQIAFGNSAPQGANTTLASELGTLGLGNYSNAAGNASAISALAGQIPGAVAPYGDVLAKNAAGAGGLVSPYTQALTSDSGIGSTVSPFAGDLRAWAALAAQNPASGMLTKEAQGGFLGQNPYIQGEFNAAASPVTRAYQTATAPQTDSNFEAAGRYGSGALANARSQNEQNLGLSLGNLASNLYGQDYANERGLMTQAQQTLGNQYLSGINTGVGAETNAGSMLTNAINSAIGANSAAGNLALGAGGLANSAASAGGNLALGAGEAGIGGLTNAANVQNAGLNATTGAASAAGGLNAGNLAAENSALGAIQSGYDTGNLAALKSLLLEPSLLGANLLPAQTQVSAGQGLTSLEQAQLNDAAQRFYGNEQAPWQSLTQYMNLVGQPTTGSSSVTSPLLGPNPLSSALGTGLGAMQLLGPSGLGLLGGGGAMSLGAPTAFSSIPAGGFGLGTAVDIGGAGLGDVAGTVAPITSGAGKGLSDILPFSLFG